MTTSTHKVEIVKLIEAFPIPGADRILRVDVFGGYPAVVGKADFIPDSLWAYIPPDSVVDAGRKEFAFLAKDANKNGMVRIRTRRFKKQTSMGLLIPAPYEFKEGEDAADFLKVVHYEPPVKGSSYPQPSRSKAQKWMGIIRNRSFKYGEKPPKLHVPHYDVDALRRFRYAYEGKKVIVTEKIHGSNVAYAFENRGLWYKLFNWNKEQNLRVRSRTVWQKMNNSGWYTTAMTEAIKKYVSKFPDHVVFGEVYGPMVQSGFDYGVTEPTFIAFDIWNSKHKNWLEHSDFLFNVVASDIPYVPVLYRGLFDFDHIVSLAEGHSLIGGSHVREGVVLSVVGENELVRQLKCVGLGYYEKSDTAKKPKDME